MTEIRATVTSYEVSIWPGDYYPPTGGHSGAPLHVRRVRE